MAKSISYKPWSSSSKVTSILFETTSKTQSYSNWKSSRLSTIKDKSWIETSSSVILVSAIMYFFINQRKNTSMRFSTSLIMMDLKISAKRNSQPWMPSTTLASVQIKSRPWSIKFPQMDKKSPKPNLSASCPWNELFLSKKWYRPWYCQFLSYFLNNDKLLNSIKLIIQPIDDVTFGIQVYTAFESWSDFA